MKVCVRCPAKVNSFLAVGPRDSLGYHPLRTVFHAVDICDELAIQDSVGETTIRCDWDGLPNENTLTKALRLYNELIALPSLEIRLTKRIPAESGLGGGSSDAAGLLRALQQFAKMPVDETQLLEIGAAVGADVPFFLVGGCAKGTHYGETVEPLPDQPTKWLCIVKPEIGVSTSTAYSKLDEFLFEWRDFSGQPEWRSRQNDFERIAPCESLELISQFEGTDAVAVGLCGSGSAVYGAFESSNSAEQAASKFDCKTWIAQTLTREESLWMS